MNYRLKIEERERRRQEEENITRKGDEMSVEEDESEDKGKENIKRVKKREGRKLKERNKKYVIFPNAI